jgi:hypothetical protein
VPLPLEIVRLAPGDGTLAVDWRRGGDGAATRDGSARAEWEPVGGPGGGAVDVPLRAGEPLAATLRGLPNGQDLRITVAQGDARSRPRLARCGPVPGTVVNYIHPDDDTYESSGRCTCSPCLLRLPDGRLLASHDIYWARGGQNLTKIFASDDEGTTWRFVSDLYPCYWTKLFVHAGALHAMGTSGEYGALLVFRSPDWGRSWSAPVTLIEAGSRERGGTLRTPMPTVALEGRLWFSFDYGSFTIGRHDSGVVSAPLGCDLMDRRSWVVSQTLRYDPAWPGAVTGGSGLGLIEGNLVVAPDGALVDILRYETMGATPDYGRAVILAIDTARPAAAPAFRKVIDFPGNLSKFHILPDGASGRYWALLNRVTLAWRRQRNILSLASSPDLEHWAVERDILNYQDNGWLEPAEKVGFQYPDFLFDGDDILALVRTALNGAHNYHDANHITFHRVPAFRGGRKGSTQ